MKTSILKSVFIATLFTSIAFSATTQANDALSSLIYEESSNIFSEVNIKSSTQVGIVSYGDDANTNAVWSSEYEQYVNPADFQQEVASIRDANEYMGRNPSAAKRMKGREIFVYNTVAGEYHLQ